MISIDIITPPDKVETIHQNELPNLKQLQEWVKGYIEVVPYFDRYLRQDCVVFCNENGKNSNSEINIYATTHWVFSEPSVLGVDYLVGTIVILYGDQKTLDKL